MSYVSKRRLRCERSKPSVSRRCSATHKQTGSARSAIPTIIQQFNLILRDVAQLVARVLWEHDVAGSNPVIPTIKGLLSHSDQESFSFQVRFQSSMFAFANRILFHSDKAKKTRTCLTEIKSSFLVLLISPTKKRLIIRDYRL